MARGHAIFAAILLVISCGPAATSGSPEPIGTPESASPSASATPSLTATPTAKRTPQPVVAAKPSDLVMRIEAFSDVCCTRATVVITTDGRFVTRDLDLYLERTLSGEGLRLVRDEILGTGLFGADLNVPVELVPRATEPPHGVSGLSFRTWNNGRLVRVSTRLISKTEESLYKPSAARTQLERLAARLTRPEEWLPASAWVQATATPYAPSAWRLATSAERVGGTPPHVNTVDWPFTTPLPDFGSVIDPSRIGFDLPLGPGDPLRCAAITSTDAGAVRAALAGAGAMIITLFADGSFTTALASSASAGGLVVLAQPLLPDQSSCASSY